MTTACAPPEALWEGFLRGDAATLTHLASCEACAALVEGHRQLEKDLLRLVDPPPPADLVHNVMARVGRAPTSIRGELRSAAVIFLVTLVLTAGSLLWLGGNLAAVSARAASSLLGWNNLFVGLTGGARALWRMDPGILTVSLSLLLLGSLVGLRRLVGGWSDSRVTS